MSSALAKRPVAADRTIGRHARRHMHADARREPPRAQPRQPAPHARADAGRPGQGRRGAALDHRQPRVGRRQPVAGGAGEGGAARWACRSTSCSPRRARMVRRWPADEVATRSKGRGVTHPRAGARAGARRDDGGDGLRARRGDGRHAAPAGHARVLHLPRRPRQPDGRRRPLRARAPATCWPFPATCRTRTRTPTRWRRRAACRWWCSPRPGSEPARAGSGPLRSGRREPRPILRRLISRGPACDFHARSARAWPRLPALCFSSPAAQRGAPLVKTQAPGFYRMMLGDFEITALLDGILDLQPSKLLTNTTPARGQARCWRARSRRTPVPTSVNAYLVNTGSQAGADRRRRRQAVRRRRSATCWPTSRPPATSPSRSTRCYITHMHGDHVGGLVADGKIGLSRTPSCAPTSATPTSGSSQAQARQGARGDEGLLRGAQIRR